MTDHIDSEALYHKLKNLPQKPGVYLFMDETGAVMYVGKSINIKKRVQSYFRRGSSTHKKIQILGRNIYDLEIRTTETELEALVLEDSFIKKFMPEYNTRQKEFKKYHYLRVTNDPYPTIKFQDTFNNSDYKNVFGPYKNFHFAEKVKQLLCDAFNVRKCTLKDPKDKCIRGEIGQCVAPCRNNISIQEYSVLIQEVLSFLDGSSKNIIKIINQKIKENSSELLFEKAVEWRDKIRFCRGFCLRQKFSYRFAHDILVIKELTKPTRRYFFVHGLLEKVINHDISYEEVDETLKHLNTMEESNQSRIELLDRAMVVYKWLKSRKTRKDYYFISN